MNASMNNTLVALAAASLCLMAIGCGEMPENPDDIMIYEGEESPTGEQGYTYPELGQPSEFARGPVLEEDFIDPSHGIQGEAEMEEDYPEAKSEGWEEASDLNELARAGEPEGRLSEGFGDGCASQGEWKRLAKVVCTSMGSDVEIAVFKTGESCGEEQYRLSRFACGVGDSEDKYSEFSSLLLGGEGACKPMETFLEYAEDICGENTKVIEAKALKNCEGEDNSNKYETVRVTCIDR